MTAHSEIGASSMYRWSECPGSVRLSRGIKSKQSVYAEEGIEAHEIAADWLNGRPAPADLDPEMYEAIKVYVDAIFYDWVTIGVKEATLLVEHKFDLSKVYPGAFGTADAAIYDPINKILYVYDFKYGAGIPVEVKGNPQLKYYGLGALLSFDVPCVEVELVIAQPRCSHPDGPIRRWRFPSIELLDFASDLAEYAKATENPNAPLVPGDHCRFCPASGICSELHGKALTLAKEEFRNDLTYDPEKLSHVLDWIPTLEGWIKSVKDFAYGEAQHGRTPPRYKLVAKRANRKWKDEKAAINYVTQDLGLTESAFSTSFKSPAQIEKMLSKEQKIELKSYYTSETSGTSLVPEHDKRPPVLLDAKSEFEIFS